MFLGDIGEPSERGETDLYSLCLVRVNDHECDVIGWRYREKCPDLALVSNRLFDTFPEVLAEAVQDMMIDSGVSVPIGNSLRAVQNSLLEAIGGLTLAHNLLKNNGDSERYTVLFTAVCDALNATTAAIEHCNDQPDQ